MTPMNCRLESFRAYAVVAIHPNGHRTVVQHLVFDTEAEAARRAEKRDLHYNAIAIGLTHEAKAVTRSTPSSPWVESEPGR